MRVVERRRAYVIPLRQNGLPRQNLASYAFGVMFSDNKHYSLTLEGARPIGDRPSDSDRRDMRVNATFTYNFRND